MDRETFRQFKILLLGLPGWNQAGARRALLQDCFWGHDLLNQLNDGVPGERAAVELIELLGALESPDVDGMGWRNGTISLRFQICGRISRQPTKLAN